MATEVFPGRYTATPDGEVTVFLIGMRINQIWRVRDWWRTAIAMPRILRHLSRHPEAGLLGFHSWGGRTTVLVSYWKDAASLQAFAADPNAPHLEPWRWYMRNIASSGTVGIWHETYTIKPGGFEAVYANMPCFGLAAATQHQPVGAGMNTARQRMERGTSPG